MKRVAPRVGQVRIWTRGSYSFNETRTAYVVVSVGDVEVDVVLFGDVARPRERWSQFSWLRENVLEDEVLCDV